MRLRTQLVDAHPADHHEKSSKPQVPALLTFTTGMVECSYLLLPLDAQVPV